jgi:tRNA pseudouridine38-40 synthase
VTARYRLDLAYDGSGFVGWQEQSKGRTVQGELKRALAKLGETTKPAGAGRTDAGVHALDFPVTVDLERDWPTDELRRALKARLPRDIQIQRAAIVPSRFHARFDAQSRTYLYVLALKESVFFRLRRWKVTVLPDSAWIEGELKILRESANVSALARAGAQPGARCRILDAGCRPLPEGAVFHVTADRFLYGMMRALTGTLVHGYAGGQASGILARVLAGERPARAAPPQGLYFAAASYAGEASCPIPFSEVIRVAGLGEP